MKNILAITGVLFIISSCSGSLTSNSDSTTKDLQDYFASNGYVVTESYKKCEETQQMCLLVGNVGFQYIGATDGARYDIYSDGIKEKRFEAYVFEEKPEQASRFCFNKGYWQFCQNMNLLTDKETISQLVQDF